MKFSLDLLADPICQYFEDLQISLSHLTWEIAGEAGSDRKYYRLQSLDQSWVLMLSPLDLDFERFVQITQWLQGRGFKVPQIYALSVQGQILLQDLGKVQLWDLLQEGKDFRIHYQKLAKSLVEFQNLGDLEILPSIREREFAMEDLLWETDYFSQHFLGQYLGISQAQIDILKTVFQTLALRVNAQAKNLMHRDFQSQNVMVLKDELWWIDYQGARYGSIYYDLASALWDPYVGLPEKDVRAVFETFCELKSLDPLEAWPEFLLASMQRLMQACGAYANLSLNKGKQDFERHLEPGRARLLQVLNLCEQEHSINGMNWHDLHFLLTQS